MIGEPLLQERIGMELLKEFDLRYVKISQEFASTVPADWKMERMKRRYDQTGELPKNIIINDDGILIDGYVTYLQAMKDGIDHLDVYRGHLEIVEAVHSGNEKVFRWSVPLRLYGCIEAGDRVLVMTARGVQRVQVKRVIRQQYPEQRFKVRKVLSKCGL